MKVIDILIIALLVLVIGCKSKESLGLNPDRLEKTRAAIASEIPDAERRQAMLDVVADFEAAVQPVFSEVKVLREKIVEANRDYDTTRGQLQELYDGLGTQLERLGNTTKEHSLKLRSLCSESEWDEIFDHDDEAINFIF